MGLCRAQVMDVHVWLLCNVHMRFSVHFCLLVNSHVQYVGLYMCVHIYESVCLCASVRVWVCVHSQIYQDVSSD